MLFDIVSFLAAVTGLYLAFYFYYESVREEVEAVFDREKMPVMRPVPIPTKNRPAFAKLLVFLFEVRRWELQRNWHYLLNMDGATFEIVIPKGFRFDGASIPRPFWAFLSPVGLLLVPGLIHDYAYRHDQLWQLNESGEVVPFREKAGKDFWDALFLAVGKDVNGFFLVDWIAWLGVRIGGRGAWNRNRRRDEKAAKPLVRRKKPPRQP